MSNDVEAPLSQIEAGMIITVLSRQKKRMLYRELVGFSPKEAAETESAKRYKITAEDIARAAGRNSPRN